MVGDGLPGVGCSGLAYLFWYDALDRIDATQAGVFLYFGPLVTALLAWPLLGEPDQRGDAGRGRGDPGRRVDGQPRGPDDAVRPT